MLPDLFKKSYSVSYEEAQKDSMIFRLGVNRIMNEMEDAQKWFEGLAKSWKSYGDSYDKYNEGQIALAKRIAIKRFPAFLEHGIMSTISESMLTLSTIQIKTFESIVDKMNILHPFYTHAKDVKEAKKALTLAFDRMDSALAKLSGFAKSKEAAAIAEQQSLVVEARKSYQTLSFEFVHKIILLKGFIDSVIADKMFVCLESLVALYDESSAVIQSLQKGARSFQAHEMPPSVEFLNNERKKWKGTVHDPMRRASAHAPKLIPDSSDRTQNARLSLAGYLYKKVDQRWSRRFVSLAAGRLTWYNVSRPVSEDDVTSINVSLCVVKFNFTEDRKYVFEVNALRSDSLILQADSEEEMLQWMDSIDLAKKTDSSAALKEGEETSTTGGLKPSVSIDSIVGTSQERLELEVNVDESDSPIPEDYSTIDSGLVDYGDLLLDKRNSELHHLFKSVPEKDFALDVFAAALQKDILLQGKCYITQNRLCFYSNIIGFVNIVVIHLNEVIDITKKQGPLQTSIIVTTSCEYVFKIYGKNERAFNVLNAVWKNAVSDAPLKPQEIYDKCTALKTEPSKNYLKTEELEDEKPLKKWGLPSNLTPPTAPVDCGCREHLDKVEYSSVIPACAREVFEILFGPNSNDFWDPIDRSKGIRNKKETPWTDDALPSKMVECTSPIPEAFMFLTYFNLKELDLIVNITTKTRDDYFCYVVEQKSFTPQLVFGEFTTNVRYCITWVSEDSCKLDISIGVIFPKNTLIKGFIKTHALKLGSQSIIPVTLRLLDIVATSKDPPVEDDTDPAYAMPSDMTPPDAPVKCECEKHLEKIDIDVIINASAKQVYETLFGSDATKFSAAMDKSRNDYNRQETPWTLDEIPTKTSTHWMHFDNPMLKMKEIEVKNTYTLLKKQDYLSYVVESKGVTPLVPYGDCFSADNRVCITFQSPKSCRLLISSEIVFTKSTMMKSIIKSNASKGSTERAQAIQNLLIQQLDKGFKSGTSKSVSYSGNPSSSTTQFVNTSETPIFSIKNIVIVLVSFFLGFLVTRLTYGPPSAPVSSSIVDWRKELRLSEPSDMATKYFKFIETHFSLYTESALIPYSNPESYHEYQNLLEYLQHIKSLKRDVSEVQIRLEEAEKHLMFGMYYNWKQGLLGVVSSRSDKKTDL